MVTRTTVMGVPPPAVLNTVGLVPGRRRLLVVPLVARMVSWQVLKTCDDGNTTGGDGCSASCIVEVPGWTCTTAPGQATACVTTCGDAVKAGAEVCDIHMDLPLRRRTGCLSSRRAEMFERLFLFDTIEYNDGCCGNGTLESGEVCDGTDFGSATCDTLTAVTNTSSSLLTP